MGAGAGAGALAEPPAGAGERCGGRGAAPGLPVVRGGGLEGAGRGAGAPRGGWAALGRLSRARSLAAACGADRALDRMTALVVGRDVLRCARC